MEEEKRSFSLSFLGARTRLRLPANGEVTARIRSMHTDVAMAIDTGHAARLAYGLPITHIGLHKPSLFYVIFVS